MPFCIFSFHKSIDKQLGQFVILVSFAYHYMIHNGTVQKQVIILRIMQFTHFILMHWCSL